MTVLPIVRKIRKTLYEILTIKPEAPDMSAEQKLNIGRGEVKSGDVKVFMFQNQVSQQINERVVSALILLDDVEEEEVKFLEAPKEEVPGIIEAQVKELPAATLPELSSEEQLEEILADLVRVCYNEYKHSLEDFIHTTKTAYLRYIFEHTKTTEESASILKVGRTYATRLFSNIGLKRKRGKRGRSSNRTQ